MKPWERDWSHETTAPENNEVDAAPKPWERDWSSEPEVTQESNVTAPPQEETSDWRKTGRDAIIGALESIPGARQLVGGAGTLLGQDYQSGKEYFDTENKEAEERSPWAHGIGETVGTAAQVVPLTGALTALAVKETGPLANFLSKFSPQSTETIANNINKLQNIGGLGFTAGTQAGMKSYLETGDADKALDDVVLSAKRAYAGPLVGKAAGLAGRGIQAAGTGVGDLAGKMTSAFERIGGGNGGIAAGLARTIPADIAGLSGTATAAYLKAKALEPILKGGGKLAGLVGQGVQKLADLPMVNDVYTPTSIAKNVGFSKLLGYLNDSDEKKKQAQNDFAQNKNNTYSEE